MTIELSSDDADCGDVNLSVEFKMWSMSPLIAVPLTNQSHSPDHNMGVTWDIIHTLT